jgi:hypothetical protein
MGQKIFLGSRLGSLGPPLGLAALALAFFGPLLLHPTAVLYSDHSDLLGEHLPAKRFWVRSFQQTGEIPLWCPYRFAGVPAVADVQLAAFYPLHWLLLALPPERVGAAVSWLVVGHVVVAGLGAYAYARWRGLGRPAAFVTGVGYMFAGKWLLQLLGGGHYIVVGLAWLPWGLLALEWAVRRGSLAAAGLAGAAFALMVLGTQPQFTFYAGILAALWSLGAVADRPDRRRGLAAWAACGAIAAAVAAGLAAVQLLPTAEAARLSSRAAGVGASDALAGGLRALRDLVGPTLADAPANLAWEDRGGLGLLWLVAAALAPVLARYRLRHETERGGMATALRGHVSPQSEDTRGVMPGQAQARLPTGDGHAHAKPWACHRAVPSETSTDLSTTGPSPGRVHYEAAVALALAAFALGGAVLFQELPGFRLFRQPTRMFLALALPVAYLAGVTTDLLFAGPPPSAEVLRRCRAVLIRVAAAIALLSGGFAVRLVLAEGRRPVPHVYWATLLVTVPAAWLLLRPGRLSPRAWCLVLLLDAWALAAPLVATRPEAEVDAPSACVRYLAERAREGPGGWRVLDRDDRPGGSGTPLGTGASQAMLCGLEAVRGVGALDCLRFKEYLQFLAGRDEPLRSIVSPLTYPVLPSLDVANQPLLDLLLGPGYLLQPSDEPADAARWEAVCTDPAPSAYDYIAGGRPVLPPYTLYRNRTGLPRAFVVHRARSLPPREQALAALTAADLRNEVLVEGDDVSAGGGPAGDRSATITDYRPNRVTVGVGDGPDGWLVLADVWYPGWHCTVDGEAVPVRRADFLFRTVPVTEGRHEVVFTYAPDSYRLGRVVSLATLGLWAAGLSAAAVFGCLRRSPARVQGVADGQ